ncbi:helix-turn-helix transcriptional regulator [Nonomuraea rhizosphaerae]|uniref:helix-turn-helix transcriptional regulator n=1 Tax=Nonomuraea rhizosphaerae TaxID=2665663 RepID=UPI001C5F729B|nr:helix-turn-helix transcriptional regulator [Nonomuraea rhizosphaerae]
MNRKELAEFLRSRRARVGPRDVGLPDGGRRRTPGLRRQEVAQLAGMSIDYYIRLEQGRGPHPSRQVLGAMARALMLTQDERTHLFNLAGQALDPPRIRRDVPEPILHLISYLEEVPAYVVDAKYEILAWNPLASAVMGDLAARAPGDLNVIRWIYRSPDIGEFLGDEDRGRFARGAVADLRAAAGRYPDDPELRALVAEMLALSPEFAQVWARHEVQMRREHVKRLVHPAVGEIVTNCQVLAVPDREDLRLVLYTAEPGSASHRALRELRQLTLSS